MLELLKEYWYIIAAGLVALLVIIIICASASKSRKKARAEANAKEVMESIGEGEVEIKEVEEKEETKPTPKKSKAKKAPVEEKVEEPKEEKPAQVEEKETKKEETAEAPKKPRAKKVPVEEKAEEPKEEVQVKEPEAKVEEKVEAPKAAPKKKPTETKTLTGKFAVAFDPTDENYRYRLYASNGELMVVSEIYASKKSALTGIATLKKNAIPENIDYVEDKHGLFSFRVLSGVGGRCLITSANYETKAGAEKAAQSFLKNVVTERIVEEQKDDHDEEEFTDIIEPVEGGKYKIVEENEEFYYQLYANNGRLIAASNPYKTKKTCLEGLEKFKALVYEGKFFIFKDKNSKYQFKLYNDQKRMMLAGEVYDTRTKVVNVITSLKRFTKDAQLIEE